jgi:hypothetical protein
MPSRKPAPPAAPLTKTQKARAKLREEAKAHGVTAKSLKPRRGPRQRRREYSFEELSKMSPSVRARALRGRSAPVLGERADATAKAALEGAEAQRRGRGRPTLLTSLVIDDIVQLMATGAGVEVCAAAIGIAPTTLSEWFARAADPNEKVQIFRDFAGSIAQARAQWEITSLGIVAAGGAPAATQGGRPGDWRGRAWLLERLKPERFGPPTKKLEHSGTGLGGAIRITGSVELPAEVPDGPPSLGAGKPSLTPRGVAESSSNGKGLPIVTEGVSLPEETDPDP